MAVNPKMARPVIVAINQSGMAVARKIKQRFGWSIHGRVERVSGADVSFENAIDHINMLFAAAHPIVGVCAAGILIRAVAPLLNDKQLEPPLIAISDDGQSVVPLLGGHRGANRLSRQISQTLGAHAAISTAGDVSLGIALDDPPPGWAIGNAHLAKSVMADLLLGRGVARVGDARDDAHWLVDLPDGDDLQIHIGLTPDADHLSFHPKRAVLGIGCSRDCPAAELAQLVRQALQQAQISEHAIAAVCSIDLKADEPAINQLAQDLSVPLRLFNAQTLELQRARLHTPSDIVFAEVGTHGVSEGAALAAAGPESQLILAKQKTEHATVAIALADQPITKLAGQARGQLSIIGIGPGQASWRTPEASKWIANADELVGYGLYIDLLGPLARGKKRTDFPLGGEEDRVRYALEQAALGRNIAMICSGDAGIYAMGALVYELLDRPEGERGVSVAAKRVLVQSAPGISALQGAAARAGAPLGHDFCAISLSDLLTPRDQIKRRILGAAQGDFVIAFYNPVSKRRRTLLNEARDILLQYRPADTPVILASDLGRPKERIRHRKLGELNVDEVDMLTVVLIGSSASRAIKTGDGMRVYTPRGYDRKQDGKQKP